MATNWAPIGRQLASLGRSGDDAFEKRLGELIRNGRADQQFRQDLLKTRALENYESALTGAGYDPAQAKLGAIIAQGGIGTDYANTELGMGRQQERGLRQSAVDAYGTGGAAAANQYRAGLGSGMLKATELEAGQLYNPTIAPEDQEVIVTPLGQSVIGANEARGAASLIRANRQPAQRPAAQEKFSQPGAQSLKMAFANAAGEINRNEFQQFQQWRAENPDLRNGEEALAKFLNSASSLGRVGSDGNWRPNRRTGGDDLPDDGIPEVESGSDIGTMATQDLYFLNPRTGKQEKLETGPSPNADRQWTQPEVQQALNDARRAVATGRITREAAAKRLLDAGLRNAAKVL